MIVYQHSLITVANTPHWYKMLIIGEAGCMETLLFYQFFHKHKSVIKIRLMFSFMFFNKMQRRMGFFFTFECDAWSCSHVTF